MKNDLARGSVIFFSKNIAVAVLGALLTTLLARSLGADGFGLLSIALSSAYLLAVLSNLALGQVSVKLLSEFNAKGKKKKVSRLLRNLISLRLALSSLTALALFLLSDSLASAFAAPALSLLLKAASFLIISFSLSRLLIDTLTGLKLFPESAKAEILDKGLALFFFIIFLLAGYGYPLFALISFIFASLTVAMYSLEKTRRYIIPERENSLYSGIFALAFPLYISGLLAELQWDFANIILGAFSTSASVGLLSLSLKISGILLLLNKSFFPLLLPFFSDLKAMQRKASEVYSRLSGYLLLPALLSSSAALFFSEELILIFGGQEYLPAVNIVRLLAFIPIISVFSNLNYNVMVSQDQTRAVFWLGLLRLFLIISFVLLLTALFGLWGSAFALLAGSLISTTASSAYLLGKEFDLKRYLRMAGPLALAIPCFMALDTATRLTLFFFFVLFYANFSVSRKDLDFFSSLKTGSRSADRIVSCSVFVLQRLRRRKP